MAADGSVIIDTKIDSKGAETGAEQIKNTVTGLADSLKILPQAFKDFPNIVRTSISSASKAIGNMRPEMKNLQDDIDLYEDALYRAERAGYGLGDVPYDEAYTKLEKAKKAAEEYKKQLLGVDSGQKKSEKSGKKLNKSLKNTEKASRGARMSMGRMLATSLLFSTVFRAISLVTSSLKEGLDNLAQYSGDTNKALSNLMSALTRLKNAFASAFAPLIQYVEPALTSFIQHLSDAVTYVGKLFAALTGKKYFEQAVDVQQDYADSLDKTSASAKKAKKNLASFDEAEVLDFSEETEKNELKPEDMYETVEIGSAILGVAEKIKNALKGLFDPIKASWDKNGPYVMEALRYAGDSIKTFASDAWASFMQVWNAEGYGKRITDDLLITFGNFVNMVGNLITNFDKAWVSGNAGTTMLRLLGDIVLEITGFFRQASESLMNWAAGLDFTPLLASFNMVLEAIRPIVSDVGDLILWLLNSVLLPIAKWGVEQTLPAVFQLIAAALKTVQSIIKALQPLGTWLWETFLQPLGKWTGEVIIAALKLLVSWLTKFSNWISQNESLVRGMASAVATFFAAWGVKKLVSEIPGMISILGSLIGKLGDLNLKLVAISTIIGAIVALADLVAKAWNKMTPGEQLATKIIAVAGAIALVVAAVAAFLHDYATLAIAGAIAAVAGISIAGISLNAIKRNSSYSSGYTGRSASPYAAVAYNMPRLATGTVVPPRAGEFAAILGDNTRETEVVSPLSTMKQALKEALLESGALNNSSSGDVYLQIDGKTFARLALPYIKSEEGRVGVRLVTGGTA